MYGFQFTPVLTCTKLFKRQKKFEHPDFVWPKQEVMEDWPLEDKIRLTRIHWKNMHGYMQLSALKFEFSNGIFSEPCEVMHQRHGNWRSIEIDESRTITKFSMLICDDRDVVSKIKIMDGEEEIANVAIADGGE